MVNNSEEVGIKRGAVFFVVVRNDVQSCRYRAGIPNVETFPHICTEALPSLSLLPRNLFVSQTFVFKKNKKKKTNKKN